MDRQNFTQHPPLPLSHQFCNCLDCHCLEPHESMGGSASPTTSWVLPATAGSHPGVILSPSIALSTRSTLLISTPIRGGSGHCPAPAREHPSPSAGYSGCLPCDVPMVYTGCPFPPGSAEMQPFGQESHPASPKGVNAPPGRHPGRTATCSLQAAGLALQRCPLPRGCMGLASAGRVYRLFLSLC